MMNRTVFIPTLCLLGFFFTIAVTGEGGNFCYDDNIYCREGSVYGFPLSEDIIYTTPNLVMEPPYAIGNYYYGYTSGYYPRRVIRSYPYRSNYYPTARPNPRRFYAPRQYRTYSYYSPYYYDREKQPYGEMGFRPYPDRPLDRTRLMIRGGEGLRPDRRGLWREPVTPQRTLSPSPPVRPRR